MSKWMDGVMEDFNKKLINGYNEGFLTTNQFHVFTSNMKKKVIKGLKGDSIVYTYDYKNLHLTVTSKGFYYIQDLEIKLKINKENKIEKIKKRIQICKEMTQTGFRDKTQEIKELEKQLKECEEL